MKKGTFCISIDLELLWGRKDLNYTKFIPKIKKERKIIKKLLELFTKYEIPVTWAVVGKLYENGDELWSGKDIINSIKKEKIHELGSHTYSHEIINQISAKQANDEFAKNKAFSFVFPRNRVKYLDLLKKNGFKVYRGPDETNTATHAIQIINLLLGVSPTTSLPIRKNGLINIPGSMYFVSARGIRRYILSGFRFRRSKSGINKAISKKEVFHLWFHPIDFSDNTTSLIREFEEILKYAAKKRNEGLLDIKTMQQITQNYK